MTKKVLRFAPDLKFDLIAITSPLRDYRLCHMLNTRLHFNFRKSDDYTLIIASNGHPTFFSRYADLWNSGDTEVFLLANKGGDGYLIPEMRSIDYFILIRGYLDAEDKQMVISGLNRMDDIHAVLQVEPARLRSHENLIF
ncbi:MAG: IPExxxVDY family protein [Mucilaginibacter polytrichastri]|nr:IPExxxVDY family protein [Mucilaginibacter polytrichastri]